MYNIFINLNDGKRIRLSQFNHIGHMKIMKIICLCRSESPLSTVCVQILDVNIKIYIFSLFMTIYLFIYLLRSLERNFNNHLK